MLVFKLKTMRHDAGGQNNFFSQSFHVKKRVYEGIAFCSSQTAQLAVQTSDERRTKISAPNCNVPTLFTIVVDSHCVTSRLFSMVYPMVIQKFAFQLCRV